MVKGLRGALAVLALVSGLAGARVAMAGEVSEAELRARIAMAPEEFRHRYDAIRAMTPQQQGEAMVAAVKDRTILYYQQGYGVFAEFTSADGKVYMWFPGNSRVVYGKWGLRDMGGPKLCYKYFNSRNYVTGEFESTECIPPEQKLLKGEVLGERAGDPFGLAAGKLPYRKSRFDVPDWPVEPATH